MTNRLLMTAVLSVCVCLTPSDVFADAAAAKEHLATANEKIQSKDFDDAEQQLELAELEAEDAGAEKAPLLEKIKAMKTLIASAKAAADLPKYQRKLDRAMKDAEDAIGNMVTWGGAASAAEELFADPVAKAALGDAFVTAQKKFATYKKLHAKKAAVYNSEIVEGVVADAEKQWAESKPVFSDPDSSPNSRESAVEDVGRSIERARKQIERLEMDAESAKPFTDRLDKLSAEFSAVALADKAKEMAERLASNVDLYRNEWDGWENEKAGPTWADYKKQSGGAMDRFNSVKTAAWLERSADFLDGLDQKENYTLVAGSPEVKAVVDKAKAEHDRAYKLLLDRVKPVYDAAMADPIGDNSAHSRLKDSIRLTLGEKSEEGLAMQEALQKKIDGHELATTGAEEAKAQMIVSLTAKAEEVWPGLYEGMPFVTEIDLTKEGEQIGFLADNLMGYRFKPGDFYFATTLGGEPVAAKFDPELMKGIKATEAAIGRSLGDDDNDGKWDVIAIVTSKKVKLMAKREVESTGTIDGSSVTITGTYAEPVDAVVIEIIAAKCGPFAGAKGKGVLKIDGTVGAP